MSLIPPPELLCPSSGQIRMNDMRASSKCENNCTREFFEQRNALSNQMFAEVLHVSAFVAALTV